MSDSKKPTSGNSGPDEVSDRLKSSLKLNVNKPDKKVQLPMGSPVSPLPTGATGGGPSTSTTATSSSSSSSGSVSGRAGSSSHATAKDASHSGEHTSPSTNTSSSAPPKKNVRFCSRSTDNSPTTRRGRGGQKGGRSTDTSPSTGTGRAGHARPPRARGDSRSPARGGRTGSDSSGSTGTHHPTSSHSRGGSVTSPPIKVVLPAGNIVPSGKISTTGLATPVSPRREVLGSGTCNYGHGSIMRGVGSIGGGSGSKSCGSVTGGSSSIGGGKGNVKDAAAVEAEAVKMAGNEQFKKGNFAEALSLYERAISLSPGNASYHCNRAAALVGVGGRILEAVKECENAVRIDPQYFKAHLRLGSLLVRIGQLEAAKKHLCLPGILPDQREHLRLQDVEKHLLRCTETRKKKDWSSTLKEATAAIAAGADECPELYSCQAESLLKLEQLDEAISVLSKIPKSDPSPNCRSQSNFFGISADAYLLYVRAQIEMSSGRFDNAMFSAEGAAKIDARNQEVASLLRTVTLVARARQRGNDLFKSDRFTEASAAYEEGLKLDPCNAILYCNRAACWYKVGSYEKSVEDCSHALRIQPSYTKALLRRANSNDKLKRWSDAVNDYEALHKKLPNDAQLAESMFNAQVALMKSQGKDVSTINFGGKVEKASSIEQYNNAVSFPGGYREAQRHV